eukprot:jgi/Mesvir1/24493/Mv21849-RA.1
MVSNLAISHTAPATCADAQRWAPQKALVAARPLATKLRRCDFRTNFPSQNARTRTEKLAQDAVRCCAAASARDGSQVNGSRPVRGERVNAGPSGAAAIPVDEQAPSSPGGDRVAAASPREAHNQAQSAFFDETAVEYFAEPLPEDVESKLARIVTAARLRPSCQVLDAGCGSGPLIPHLLAAGVSETSIVAVDLSPVMLSLVKEQFDDVTCWLGDVTRMPDGFARGHDTDRLFEEGGAGGDVCVWPCFDAVFFNAMFGNLFDQVDALRSVARQCAVGARVVISHPLGRAFVRDLHRANPSLVPHELPDERQLADMVQGLPLRLDSVVDEPDFYVAVLERVEGSAVQSQRAKRRASTGKSRTEEGGATAGSAPQDDADTLTACRPGGSVKDCAQEIYERLVGSVAAPRFYTHPVYMEGPVVSGYQRGSKEMGIPTANLPPDRLTDALRGLDKGVYYGFAQLQPQEGVPAGRGDLDVHEMVLNIGDRPTFAGQGISVEAHILHKYANDFYGRHLKVMLLGFVRPERRFSSPTDLIAQIHADIEVSKAQLSTPECAVWKDSTYFSRSS